MSLSYNFVKGFRHVSSRLGRPERERDARAASGGHNGQRFRGVRVKFYLFGGEGYPLAGAILASGLDPERALNEYPESMTRSLLNAGLMRSDLPPRWVMELLEGLGRARS